MAKTRFLALGGAALVAAGGVVFRRRRARARLGAPAPAPSSAPTGVRAAEPPAAPAPGVANVDVAGPPENTSTAIPAPAAETAAHEGQIPDVLDDTGGIDEVAEEAAAAAEAANIGGGVPEYVEGDGSGDRIDEAERAVVEGGGGESEGFEIAESDLIENAEDDFDRKSEAEKQIDEVIEDQDDPSKGEVGVPSADRVDDVAAEQAEQAVWREDDWQQQPTVESPRVDPDAK